MGSLRWGLWDVLEKAFERKGKKHLELIVSITDKNVWALCKSIKVLAWKMRPLVEDTWHWRKRVRKPFSVLWIRKPQYLGNGSLYEQFPVLFKVNSCLESETTRRGYLAPMRKTEKTIFRCVDKKVIKEALNLGNRSLYEHFLFLYKVNFLFPISQKWNVLKISHG